MLWTFFTFRLSGQPRVRIFREGLQKREIGQNKPEGRKGRETKQERNGTIDQR